MDVDLLRPGTVPISPHTVLWFEFLLDEKLLPKHLEKEKADPSPTDLIIKFTNAVLESVKNENSGAAIKRPEQEPNESMENGTVEFIKPKPQDTLKNLALKILSLRTASFLKWNLDIWEMKLPAKVQVCLLQDLFYFAKEKIEIPNIPECDVSTISDPFLFALILYHRWLIRMSVQQSLQVRIGRAPGVPPNVGTMTANSTNVDAIGVLGTDDVPICTPELVTASVDFLTGILTSGRFPPVPTLETFRMLTEDSTQVEHDWARSAKISPYEYEAQIHYDLGCFYFNREKYSVAQQHFMRASESYYGLNVDADLEYASLDVNRLNGYLCACDVPVEERTPSLLQQMNTSIADHYTGILSVLQEDNLVQEIPFVYRTVLELDIQGALSSGKFTVARDLLQQVQALNAVRAAMDVDAPLRAPSDLVHRLRCGGTRSLDILLWALAPIVDLGSEEACEKARNFLLSTLIELRPSQEIIERLLTTENGRWSKFLSPENIRLLSTGSSESISIPPILLAAANPADWERPGGQQPWRHLDIRSLERKLIASYDAQQIRRILAELAAAGGGSSSNNGRPVWLWNSSWELSIPLKSAVVALPSHYGPLQDLSYILAAKSREMLAAKDYERSLLLLVDLEQEAKTQQMQKLCRLVQWEMLLVRITKLHAEWLTTGTSSALVDVDERDALIRDCKQCLAALEERGECAILPRLEVVEQCALCLLNCGEWEYLCGLEKRWSYFEMPAAVAYACQDLIKYKGVKKVSRDMWDLVLPIFGPTPPSGSQSSVITGGLQQNSGSLQAKRTSSGATTLVQRSTESPNAGRTIGKSQLSAFLAGIRDATAMSVCISMMARLYNVLRDEPSLELSVQNITLWPAVVSNANSYSWRGVLEQLSQLVSQALHLYSSSITWLRLSADIAFATNQYEAALQRYLESLSAATDHFEQPPVATKGGADEHCIRRMIKCCTSIGCHTQAAVLAQFLEDTDYALAFKCLGDSKQSISTSTQSGQQQQCHDSVDAYYGCIWDTTLLEYLVHLHHKRGEHHRKQQAVKAIGMLELNSNNNEEIQREAMNIRKSRFLRALSNHYLTRTP